MGLRTTMWPYVWPHIHTLIGLFGCLLGGAVATMALVPLAKFATEAFGHLTLVALNQIVAGLIGLYFLKGVFTFGQVALAGRFSLAITTRLREDVFAHLLGLGLRYHGRQRPTDLASRLVQDLEVVREAVALAMGEALPGLLVIAYALVTLFVLNWRLALCSLVGAPLVGWAIAGFGRRLHGVASEGQARKAELLVCATEILMAFGAFKAFGREDLALARFRRSNERQAAVQARFVHVSALQPPVIAVLHTTALASVLWVGGWEIIQGRLAGPDLIAFAAAIGIAVDPTLALSQAWGRLQIARAAGGRVFALLAAADRLEEPIEPAPLGRIGGGLILEGVDFAFEPGRPVLEGVDLVIAPGQVTALVGPSGGGKSSIVALLLRLHDPVAGRVLLDGRDLRTIASAELRRAIAYVPQDPLLLAGTIAENLALGDPAASREAMVRACHIANAHEFIAALPLGYDAPLGEGGAGLSGGQRQRLALARALLVDPRILILDEATAALDPPGEEAVREAVARAMHGRTTVIVAHRPGAIGGADRIYVIAGGRVVESGTREALQGKSGVFSAMFEPIMPSRDIYSQ